MKFGAILLVISGSLLMIAGPMMLFFSPNTPVALMSGSGLVILAIGLIAWGAVNKDEMKEDLRQTLQKIVIKKCPVCGGAEFDLGTLSAQYGVWFISYLKKGIIPKRLRVQAVACKGCGHVMVFLENKP